MTAGSPITVVCPNCGQMDQIQKVSAVVKAGTTTGALTGTTTGGGNDASHTLKRDSQTLLSKLLASPKKPFFLGLPRWQQRGIQIVVTVFGVVTIGLIVFQAMNAHDSGKLHAIATQMLAIGFLGIIYAYVIFVGIGNRAYNKARAKWNKTYYCHRCDQFFLPGKKSDKKPYKPLLAAPEDMQLWLRKRKWKK